MTIGMLRHCPRLAGASDRRATIVVGEGAADGGKASVDRTPHRDFAIRLEQRTKIVLVVGQQEGTNARRLEQPHIPGLPAGHVDMRVERDARSAQHLVHLRSPDSALVAAMERRRGGECLWPTSE